MTTQATWSPVLQNLHLIQAHLWLLRAWKRACRVSLDHSGTWQMTADECRRNWCSQGDCLARSAMHINQTLMASSHREHGQDTTVLSCPCSRCELIWRQVKTVWDWKFWKFCPVSKCGVNWVLSCPVVQFPIRNVVTYCNVIFGN